MNYIMKSGCLSGEQSGEIIAKIKSTLTGPVKKIARSESEYYTDIRSRTLTTAEIIEHCVTDKRDIVSRDFRDNGEALFT